MITKDLVQKTIISMGGQSIRDDKNFIDLKTLTVLEQLYRELNFRPVSCATSILHVNRKDHLIDELIRLLGYRSVMSFCN